MTNFERPSGDIPDSVSRFIRRITRGFGGPDESSIEGLSQPEIPPDLLAEQQMVQASKFHEREPDEYDGLIFPGRDFYPNSVNTFLRPFCHDGTPSLMALLHGLHETLGRPVRYTDMGGGRGLPLRRIASSHLRGRVRATNVDLFDWGSQGLDASMLRYYSDRGYDLEDATKKPPFIQADIETVVLPEPSDLITSIESIQYVSNPLAALCNWYNQSRDNGLLVVTTSHEWSHWILYQREGGLASRTATPTMDLIAELKEKEIPHAIATRGAFDGEKLDPRYFSNLVMQKIPGTRLVINGHAPNVTLDTSPNTEHYKITGYERPADGRPLIEIVS